MYVYNWCSHVDVIHLCNDCKLANYPINSCLDVIMLANIINAIFPCNDVSLVNDVGRRKDRIEAVVRRKRN